MLKLFITGAQQLVAQATLPHRSAADVLLDLTEQDDLAPESSGNHKTPSSFSGKPGTGLRWAAGGLALGLALAALRGQGVSQFIPAAILGTSIGYLSSRIAAARANDRRREHMEFYLPIVMERIVMAVQSGLDIIPGLRAAIEHDRQAYAFAADGQSAEPDPVSNLLRRVCALTEGGQCFEQALREVAREAACPAVKHAFIHLAVAHREGGELMQPLRELSDATQLYYQDSVDEQIAKLPVKATLPLLCTFTGLIICFITPPIVQVMHTVLSGMPR